MNLDQYAVECRGDQLTDTTNKKYLCNLSQTRIFDSYIVTDLTHIFIKLRLAKY